jgi:hypothetical protein
MSDDDSSRPECDRYADELAELALGIMTGRERAQALAHVEGCPSCHAEMEQLSLAADSLLEVVPGIEPPLGFEVRLMERLGAGRTARRLVRRHWRLRQSSLVLACLLLFVAVGAGTGWLVRGSQHPTIAPSAFGTEHGGKLETASLVAAGHAVGEVVVYSGRTSWLSMSLDDGSWSGEATCEVRLADGTSVPLGTFWLEKGYGAWDVVLPPGTGPIELASVVTDQGVLASARFAAGPKTPAAGEASDQAATVSGRRWMTR